MSQKRVKETESQTKYSWQFWCIVSGFIATIAMVILLLGLSIKAVVQDIQLIAYKNKVEGTVSVAEFKGGQWEYDESGTGQRQKFDEVHYIISFDEDIQEIGYIYGYLKCFIYFVCV